MTEIIWTLRKAMERELARTAKAAGFGFAMCGVVVIRGKHK